MGALLTRLYGIDQNTPYGFKFSGITLWLLAADAGAVQYGFLWNNPSYGAVDFGAEGTTWSARGHAHMHTEAQKIRNFWYAGTTTTE